MYEFKNSLDFYCKWNYPQGSIKIRRSMDKSVGLAAMADSPNQLSLQQTYMVSRKSYLLPDNNSVSVLRRMGSRRLYPIFKTPSLIGDQLVILPVDYSASV